MRKVFYIIPGWEDVCDDRPYQLLANIVKKKGYEVLCHNVDWKTQLSKQVFAVPNGAVVFGFSLGAILAWLVAQKYPCRHIILASMTPQHNFTDPKTKRDLIDLVGDQIVTDINLNLKRKHRARRQTILYGDLEQEQADILVPNTAHELTNNYIKEIKKLI